MTKKAVRILIRWLGLLTMLGLAGIILLVSMARASLSLTLKKEKEDALRKVPVRLLKEREDGSVTVDVYMLPTVRTLPHNVFYGVKRIRDLMWIGFCQERDEKISLAMLLADKKIAETQILFVNGQADWAMKAAEDGINLLERAKKLWSELDDQAEEKMVIKIKIKTAGLVYEKILKRAEGAVDVNQAEYERIIKRLQKINEEEE
jgi:hypothetical protein